MRNRRRRTIGIEAYREPRGGSSRRQRVDVCLGRLAELGDTFGSRLSGIGNARRGIKWAAAEMRKDGLENVRLEPVRSPNWVRGAESLEIVTTVRQPLVMLGLGNSVGTPPMASWPTCSSSAISSNWTPPVTA